MVVNTIIDRLLLSIEAKSNAQKTFSRLDKTLDAVDAKSKAVQNTLSKPPVGMDKRTKAAERLEAELNKVEKRVGRIDKLESILGKIGKAGGLRAQGFDVTKINSDLKILGKQAGVTGKQFEQAFKRGSIAANQFDMRLLSLLFGGMALQRAFGGILRNITNTFMKAEGNTSGLAQATTRLGAAWEFFKFSLFDALDTPAFINLIDGAIFLIDKFSQMDKGAKIAILSIVGGLSLIGTGMMLIGQIALGWNSIFATGGLARTANKIHEKTLGANGVFTALKTFALTGIAIKTAFDIKKFIDGEKNIRGLIDALGDDLALIGLVSGKPWIIAIGLAPKLLPLGAKIGDFGANMVERGINRLKESFTTGADEAQGSIGQSFSNTLDIFTGAVEVASGAVINGFGIVLESADNYITNIENGGKITDSFVDVMNRDLVPAITSTSDVLTKNDDSLNNSLMTVGGEMDIVAGEKTEGFIGASQERITQIEAEIDANERLRDSQAQSFREFETDVRNYRDRSSVSAP